MNAFLPVNAERNTPPQVAREALAYPTLGVSGRCVREG